MDGSPDDSIPEEDQLWALNSVQEFHYRKMFGLTKQEVSEEPMDDFIVNTKIEELIGKRQKASESLIEQRTKRGVR